MASLNRNLVGGVVLQLAVAWAGGVLSIPVLRVQSVIVEFVMPDEIPARPSGWVFIHEFHQESTDQRDAYHQANDKDGTFCRQYPPGLGNRWIAFELPAEGERLKSVRFRFPLGAVWASQFN